MPFWANLDVTRLPCFGFEGWTTAVRRSIDSGVLHLYPIADAGVAEWLNAPDL